MPTYDKDGNFYIGVETNAEEAAEQLRKLEHVLRDCHTASKKVSDSETSSDKKELESKTKLARQQEKQIRQEKELGRQQRKNTDIERNRFSQNVKLLKQLAGIAGTVFAAKKIVDFGRGVLAESRMLNAADFSYGLDPQKLKALGFLSKEFGGNDATAKQTLENLKQIAFLVGKGQNPISETGMLLGGAGIFRDKNDNLTQDPFIILSNLAQRMQELEKMGQPDDARELGRAFGLNDSVTSALRKYGTDFSSQLQQQAETIALNKEMVSQFQQTNRNIDEIKKIFGNRLTKNLATLNKELLVPLTGWLAENPGVVKKIADALLPIAGIGASLVGLSAIGTAINGIATVIKGIATAVNILVKIGGILSLQNLLAIAVAVAFFKIGQLIWKWIEKIKLGEAITDTLADMIYTLSGDKKRDADAENSMRDKIQKKHWDNLYREALQELKMEEDPFIADTIPQEPSGIVNSFDALVDLLRSEFNLKRAVDHIAPMLHTPLNSMNSNTINNLGNSSNTSNSAVTRVGTINITAANSQPQEIAAAVERGLRISDFAMLDYMNSGGFRV